MRDGLTNTSCNLFSKVARPCPSPSPRTGGCPRSVTVGAKSKFWKWKSFQQERVDTLLQLLWHKTPGWIPSENLQILEFKTSCFCSYLNPLITACTCLFRFSSWTALPVCPPSMGLKNFHISSQNWWPPVVTIGTAGTEHTEELPKNKPLPVYCWKEDFGN